MHKAKMATNNGFDSRYSLRIKALIHKAFFFELLCASSKYVDFMVGVCKKIYTPMQVY